MFIFFSSAAPQSKTNENKVNKISTCRLYYSFWIWSVQPFRIYRDTERPILVCFLIFLLFYEMECSWETFLIVKELRASDKTSFSPCGSTTSHRKSAQQQQRWNYSGLPALGQEGNCENLNFIENQKPVDRMLSELTQEILSWSHRISQYSEKDLEPKAQGIV